MTIERTTAAATTAADERSDWFPTRVAWLIGSGMVVVACWWALWTLRVYWNPAFFFGVWTAATVFVRTLAGDEPLPLRRHLWLMALSMPLWWWFEWVNQWVQNWTYHSHYPYEGLEYQLWASLTFSTVVPAVDAACRLAFRFAGVRDVGSVQLSGRSLAVELIVGLIGQGLIFLAPALFYGLTWVAPFLVLDALVGLRGGTNLLALTLDRQWLLPVTVGLAGVGCGFFWEMWNFWASPKWTYDIPYLHFFQLFEMPILGYGGYVPFAWSIYQLVRLCESLLGTRPGAVASHSPGR